MQQTLALDLKTGTLSLVSSREALTSLTLRRGGRYGLRLFVTEHGSPVDLPAGYTVESSAKQSADSSNALIFSPWSGVSPVECTLHAAGTVLDSLLAADGDASNDVESVDLAFDVLVLDGSGEVVAQSQRVTLTVENTVTRGGESGPELAPLSARLIESLPAITGLVGGEPEHLDARATAALPIGWRVLVKDGDWLRLFELAAHSGEDLPEDAVLPVDHDASTNAKAWIPATFEGVTAEELTAALAGKADASALSAHTGNTSNPHNVTAAQVGLGSVPNFGIASQAEAEAGTESSKLMTPERTAQAIAALGGSGGGTGDVEGPASATGDAYAVYDGTTGKSLKDSGISFRNQPFLIVLKNVPVETVGAPADIATINLPSWCTRYRLVGSGTGAQTLMVIEGASSTLTNVTFSLRGGSGGGVPQVSATWTGPGGNTVTTSAIGNNGNALQTSQTLYLWQHGNATFATNVSLYLWIYPLL